MRKFHRQKFKCICGMSVSLATFKFCRSFFTLFLSFNLLINQLFITHPSKSLDTWWWSAIFSLTPDLWKSMNVKILMLWVWWSAADAPWLWLRGKFLWNHLVTLLPSPLNDSGYDSSNSSRQKTFFFPPPVWRIYWFFFFNVRNFTKCRTAVMEPLTQVNCHSLKLATLLASS